MLNKFWTKLSITFSRNYAAEGFERTFKKFDLPENAFLLDFPLKRKATICNLFADQNLSMRDIAHLLEVGKGQVISTLIESKLVLERRRKTRKVRLDRRDKYHIAKNDSIVGAEGKLSSLCGSASYNIVSEFIATSLLKSSEVCERCMAENRRGKG